MKGGFLRDDTTGALVFQLPSGVVVPANSVDTSAIVAKAVTAAKLADALKPSAGAADATEALRALGKTAGLAAGGVDTEYAFSSYKRLYTARTRLDALAATSSGFNEGGTNSFGAAGGAFNAFYLDPAEWSAGAGRTTKLRLGLGALVNAVAPGCDISIALVPVSAPAGAAATVSVTGGAAVTGSTASIASASLTAGGSPRANADFDAPAAGWYALQFTVAAPGMSANSSVAIRGALSVRQV